MSDAGLDEVDRRIVAALQADPRAELLDISAKTGIPGTTVRDRLKAMEERGVIEGYTARIDYEQVGFETTALVRMQVADDAVPRVVERLRETNRFLSVYELTGRWNVLAVGRFASRAEFDRYSNELVTSDDIRAVNTDVVTGVVKECDQPAPPDFD